MNGQIKIVVAIMRKDLRGIAPFALLTACLFLVDAIIANLQDVEAQSVLVTLQFYVPYLVYFACGALIFAVFQLDPANSLEHDWLVRPIAKHSLLLAKISLILLCLFLPMFSARLLVNLFHGLSVLESLLEASHVENSWTLLTIPALMAVAILSRSMLQSAGLLIALLLLLLIVASIPPLFTPSPDAVGGEISLTSIDWLLGYFLALVSLATLFAVYWIQYGRRQFNRAKAVMAGSFAVLTALVLSIMAVPSWGAMFALLQASVGTPDESVQAALKLDPVAACFPATRLSIDASTRAGGRGDFVGAQHWASFQVARAGDGAVSFASTVRPRALPLDWRLFTLKASATYTADSLVDGIRLTPSGSFYGNPIDPDTNASTHFWLLPGEQAETLLNEPSTRLEIDYSLAALSPTVYEIPMDGRRKHYPGIGYCSASRDEVANTADLSCFKRGLQPALISAELKHLPATRVDSGRPNFTPRWLQLFDGQHYELAVPSPSLGFSDVLTVTAYEIEELFEKTYSAPGLIGADTASCPVSTEHLLQRADWSDSSPHESRFIEVENGVFLEVLDWGGVGPSLVLLPGGGATAHSYDSLAPKLVDLGYRVIAITRRGFGASSQPDYGYGIHRLSRDVLEVMDSLAFESAVLIGHSLAGHELAVLGQEHPQRFRGLVFLDAAYDNSGVAGGNREQEYWNKLPGSPGPTPAELLSYQALTDYLERLGGMPIPEGEIMAVFDFATGRPNLDPRIADAIMAGLAPPHYERIDLPSLAIYGIEQDSPEDYMRPWFDADDPLIQESVTQLFAMRSRFQWEQIDHFREQVPQAEVVVLQDSDHWVFVANEDEVLAAMEGFIGGL